MASPNSSQAQVFASATALAAAHLAAPISRLRGPTSQPQPIGLLLQPGSVPYCWCLPPGSRIAAVTGTADLTATVTGSSIDNRWGEHGPLGSMSPTSPGIWSKLSRRWKLNTALAEGSARCSQ
ncbi:hypothetical protein AMECASPLE_024819 [Ameca splendens]|uniref:Uncharacterized protein n=1 Tax=Ameca splendens TaxID=208324 RepID=A0ABV0Y4S5_9TELE